MKPHVKPTAQELEANAQAALAEVEALEEAPAPAETPAPVEPEAPVEPKTPETPVETETPIEVETPEPDYKKKFSESSREAQKINAKNKVLNQAIAQAGEIDDVSEDELLKYHPDWEIMTDTEKRLAREALISTKRFQIMHEASKVTEKIEKWGEDVDKYLEDPKLLVDHPELEGKLDDLKYFATLQGNHGTDLTTLTKAFLYEQSIKPKPVNKGAMFETGSGGPNDRIKPKSDKLTVSEGATLMKTDYKKWLEYSRAGKIELAFE